MTAQTILVIDDHVILAKAFTLALERDGFIVHTAHTAEDGLQLAQIKHPSAIVVDLRMPFINGAGFLYRLRGIPEHRDTPVLVVTGGAVNEEMRTELADLRAALRFKPLSLVQLLAEVHALLASVPLAAPVLPSRTIRQ